MKKVRYFTLLVLLLCSNTIYADGTEALSGASSGVAQYMPYIRATLLAVAAVIAVGGSLAVYVKMQHETASVKHLVVPLVGSCIMLTSAAIALPTFFGYEESGSFTLASSSSSGSGSNQGGSGSDDIGVPIDTEIPGLDDPRWKPDPQYQ